MRPPPHRSNHNTHNPIQTKSTAKAITHSPLRSVCLCGFNGYCLVRANAAIMLTTPLNASMIPAMRIISAVEAPGANRAYAPSSTQAMPMISGTHHKVSPQRLRLTAV